MSLIQTINVRLKSNSTLYWLAREWYVTLYIKLKKITDTPVPTKRKRVLFYHVNSLGHAGTEKFIQILAKYLDKDTHEVFYLYPENKRNETGYKERYDYVEKSGAKMIPFLYETVSSVPPYFISGMNPQIHLLIAGLGIDLFVTAGAGHADFPFTGIKNIPIILLNIFGQPNCQKNIAFHLCISKEVAEKITGIVPQNKIKVFPVPSEGPHPDAPTLGLKLREQFNIDKKHTVFGRIGRADNAIHDSIGIEAFKLALTKRKDIHYLIMSAPSDLIEQVRNENIPNVHFVKASSEESDIWAFHAAIDALAHFRKDGESYGLNIVESMLSGKPIITHRSHIWNAHLEYLDESFSRVTNQNDVDTYAKYLLEFADLKDSGLLPEMGLKAKVKSENMFHITSLIKDFEGLIKQAVS